MAKVIESANQLQLKLSVLEKIFALHGDIWVDKSLLTKKVMVENPWRREVIKGFRAPGAAIPFVVLLGTMRYLGGKDSLPFITAQQWIFMSLRTLPIRDG